MKLRRVKKAFDTEDWSAIWVPIAVELTKKYLLPLIFGKKGTKGKVVHKLIKGNIPDLPGIESLSVSPRLGIVKVDTDIMKVNQVMRMMAPVAQDTGARIIVMGKGLDYIDLDDRTLKKFGLQRIPLEKDETSDPNYLRFLEDSEEK